MNKIKKKSHSEIVLFNIQWNTPAHRLPPRVKGQPRVIKVNKLSSTQLTDTVFQIFFKFFCIRACVIVVHLNKLIPASHGGSTWNLASISPVVSEMFEECGRRRRWTEAYKLTYEPLRLKCLRILLWQNSEKFMVQMSCR